METFRTQMAQLQTRSRMTTIPRRQRAKTTAPQLERMPSLPMTRRRKKRMRKRSRIQRINLRRVSAFQNQIAGMEYTSALWILLGWPREGNVCPVAMLYKCSNKKMILTVV